MSQREENQLLNAIDAVCDRFEDAWLQGETPRLEDFLPDWESPRRERLLRHLLEIELEYRHKAGQFVGASEYVNRFPELAAVVEEALQHGGTVAPSPSTDETARPGGASQQQTCQRCAAANPSGHTFCGACGELLKLGTTRALTASASHLAACGPERFVPGMVFAGRYRIVALLGRGGMGEVYRADDLTLGQPVALKYLAESLKANSQALQYFLNEVKLARQITHPNVCRVYDLGEVGGHHFLSMEYIDGEDLRSLIQRIGRLPEDKGIAVAKQLCAGLAAAHGNGILHRDLKPANVMIDGRGRAKITDFGLAQVGDAARENEGLVGTPAYMAPEQFQEHQTSVQSDIYALGLIFYFMFTGRNARQLGPGTDLTELIAHESGYDPREIVPNLHPQVVRTIGDCLRVDPHTRPRSAQAVAGGLPGLDPLDEAIAAGDTPSPEMVAAGGREQHFPHKTALVCYLVTLGALLAAVGMSQVLQGKLERNQPPTVLLHHARQLAAGFGRPLTRGDDEAWGYEIDRQVLAYLGQRGTSWDQVPPALPATPPGPAVVRKAPKSTGPGEPPATRPAVSQPGAAQSGGAPGDRAGGSGARSDILMLLAPAAAGSEAGSAGEGTEPPAPGLAKASLSYFWYRRAASPLLPQRPDWSGENFLAVDQQRPALAEAMLGMRVSDSGKLIEFYAFPEKAADRPAADDPQTPPQGNSAEPDRVGVSEQAIHQLLSASIVAAHYHAGLLQPTAPEGEVPLPYDARRAWRVAASPLTGPVRVEAAFREGRPVYFRVVTPWNALRDVLPFRARTLAGTNPLRSAMLLIWLPALLLTSVLLARHNLRLGRGHRQGASRLATMLFGVSLIVWLLKDQHVWDGGELDLFLTALSGALLLATVLWFAYIAIEPFVRRLWPNTLVSWTRLLTGQWRDALVGRDLLLGTLVGALVGLLKFALCLIPLGLKLPGNAFPNIMNLPVLAGGRVALAEVLLAGAHAVLYSVFNQLLFLLLLFVIFRRQWLAGAVYVAFMSVLVAARVEPLWLGLLLTAVEMTLTVLLFIRFGLLGVAAMHFTRLLLKFPLTFDLSQWYSETGLFAVAVSLAVATLGLWLVYQKRPVTTG